MMLLIILQKLNNIGLMGRPSSSVFTGRATRSFGPGLKDLPENIARLVTGSYSWRHGNRSFIMCGTSSQWKNLWYSLSRGGTLMSGQKPIGHQRRNIVNELEEKGILVMAESNATLREEIPAAYKDVERWLCVEKAGLARRVVYAQPIAVMKG